MSRVHCLNPIANPLSEILILGSMPGAASLKAGQYYAHPQNSFWKILAELFRFKCDVPYEQRVLALLSARIAVWDVINACYRTGSLDAKINQNSITVNDFQHFFKTHPAVSKVFFNGGKAESCYQRYVLPTLKLDSLIYTRLPSTSPAHASLSYAQKRDAWQIIKTVT